MEEKETKFNVSKDVSKRTHNGITFDSVLEMKYYRDVVLPQVESGGIKHYEMQKPYTLQPRFTRNGKSVNPIVYVADFYIQYADNHEVVIDIKGCPDATAKLKRKMFWYAYPDVQYDWICYSQADGGWCTYETVRDGRAKRKKEKKEKEENGKERK